MATMETLCHNLKYTQNANFGMQKLGILASILLLCGALLGPVGISFAEDTNSTSVETKTETKMETKTTAKPLSDEEKVWKKIAEEKAKIRAKLDKRVQEIKEKALKKQSKLDDLVAKRMQVLEQKHAINSGMQANQTKMMDKKEDE